MCGIFAVAGRIKGVHKVVLEALKKLEYRGYDSWGVCYISSAVRNKERSVRIIKKTGKINNAKLPQDKSAVVSFGHTRWATHGKVTEANAHPHKDCSGRFIIIHNGIIENYLELRDKLYGKHKLESQTDTEIAVHLVEDNFNQLNKTQPGEDSVNFTYAVRKAFLQLDGLNALIVLDSKTGSFIAAKNGSPLVLGRGTNGNFLASDAHALIGHADKVYYLEDGQFCYIDDTQIKLFNVSNGLPVKADFRKLDLKAVNVSKGKFKHFLFKEINEQPKIISLITSDKKAEINKLSALINNSYGTYFLGCGTAFYACLCATYIYSKIAGRHVNCSQASEFSYVSDFLKENSLVVALSQSGETIDLIEAVNSARGQNARIASLVNVLGSTLYRGADHKFLLSAGPEQAVVSTKAFTAKLTYLFLSAFFLAGKFREGEEKIKKASRVLSDILEKDSLKRIKKLAIKLALSEHIYVIGRGMSYPIALECALKIKEASYIHAEGFAAGELKHGVIALIDRGTPSIVFAPNDETYHSSISAALEMKARGAYIIGISYKNHEVFDYFIPVEDCQETWIIPAVSVGQLMGYYLALGKGYDPDKPRNLAKSVTVK